MNEETILQRWEDAINQQACMMDTGVYEHLKAELKRARDDYEDELPTPEKMGAEEFFEVEGFYFLRATGKCIGMRESEDKTSGTITAQKEGRYCYSKVNGTTFREKEDGELPWSFMKEGQNLRLIREPDNAFDKNAIQIWFQKFPEVDKRHIGYIPKDTAIALAALMDDGKLDFWAKITEVTGGTEEKPNYGINIEILYKVIEEEKPLTLKNGREISPEGAALIDKIAETPLEREFNCFSFDGAGCTRVDRRSAACNEDPNDCDDYQEA